MGGAVRAAGAARVRAFCRNRSGSHRRVVRDRGPAPGHARDHAEGVGEGNLFSHRVTEARRHRGTANPEAYTTRKGPFLGFTDLRPGSAEEFRRIEISLIR